MLDPRELITVEPSADEIETPDEGLVLVHALDGFVDAGDATALARDHLLTTFEHRTVARFDVDQLVDYRARRPVMEFVNDHWASYADPELVVSVLRDVAGTPFLLLSGPEPDYQWERFMAATELLIDRLGVRLTVGMSAIPLGVPHTRPAGVTAHATREELVAGFEQWLSSARVPSSVGHLLELRLGQHGHDAAGFAAHVPHYVAQSEYPPAAVTLLESLARVTGLLLPTDSLREAAELTTAKVNKEVAQTPEAAAVVAALEQQYDTWAEARGRQDLLTATSTPLPSADELGAQFERFLAEQARHPDQPDQ